MAAPGWVELRVRGVGVGRMDVGPWPILQAGGPSAQTAGNSGLFPSSQNPGLALSLARRRLSGPRQRPSSPGRGHSVPTPCAPPQSPSRKRVPPPRVHWVWAGLLTHWDPWGAGLWRAEPRSRGTQVSRVTLTLTLTSSPQMCREGLRRRRRGEGRFGGSESRDSHVCRDSNKQGAKASLTGQGLK